MKGTIFSVTVAIRLIPPMITMPTRIAIKTPKIVPPKGESMPRLPRKMLAAWLLWNMLPPPNDPPMHMIAKSTASTFPNCFMFRSARPFER